MRVAVMVVLIYSVLLVLTVGYRHYHLTLVLNKELDIYIEQQLRRSPIIHQQTLFSEVLLTQIHEKYTPDTKNLTTSSTSYELVTMNPCNPRIQHCS